MELVAPGAQLAIAKEKLPLLRDARFRIDRVCTVMFPCQRYRVGPLSNGNGGWVNRYSIAAVAAGNTTPEFGEKPPTRHK